MKAKSKAPIAPPTPQEHVRSKHLNRGLVLAAMGSIFLVIVFAIWLSEAGGAEERANPTVQPSATGILENADLPPILREDDELRARQAAMAEARNALQANRAEGEADDAESTVGGGEASAGGETPSSEEDLQRERVRALAERLRALHDAQAQGGPSSSETERRFYQDQLERRRRAGTLDAASGIGARTLEGTGDDRHQRAVAAAPPMITASRAGSSHAPPETSGNSHVDLLHSAQKLAASRGDGAMSQMLASLATVYAETSVDDEGMEVVGVGRAASERPAPASAAGTSPRRGILQLDVPLTPYEVKQGTVIPAILETAVNSDVPGGVRGRTTRDVYDTRTQRHLLIPKNSTIVGEAGSEQGSDRLGIVWTRVILPDGRAIDLDAQETKDGTGASGLPGDVDNHFVRRFRSALLVSMVGAGVKIATYDDSQGVLARPQIGEVVGGSAAEQTGEVATELLRRGVNIRPTVRIPPGQAFHVYVNEDLAFEAPYRPADGYVTQW